MSNIDADNKKNLISFMKTEQNAREFFKNILDKEITISISYSIM